MTQGPPAPPPGPPPGWYPPPQPRPPGYGPAPYYPLPAAGGTNGLAVASLVVGIVGLALCWIPFVGAGLPVLALALGAAGLGRARATGPGRGPGIAGVVLGALGLLGAVTVTTLFLFLWPRISPCVDSRLSPDAQARCLRDHFGVPQPGPSVPVVGPQFSVRARLPPVETGTVRPRDRS